VKEIAIPRPFIDLLKPKRYKIFYGGRGGAKSHNFARALLVLGAQRKLRIACGREIQKNINESVKPLLESIIYDHGLDSFYQVMDKEIRGKNGTVFMFMGLKHNIQGIRSLEGVDILWVEEAAPVSDKTWELVLPTMRKSGSEIWASFNPMSPEDPVYKRFVAGADADTLVRKVSWRDNPFLTDELLKEKDKLKRADPDAYAHVWEGEFDTRRSGAVYARMLAKAREEGRICRVPYDPSAEVFTAWDLGFTDCTAIWWLQFVGRELRWLEYYENSGELLDHYAQVIKSRPYNYRHAGHFLPHDGKQGNIRGESVKAQLGRMGVLCTVLDREPNIQPGIELVKTALAYSALDADKCKDGIHALDNYGYEWDEDRGTFKKNPRHDWTSHAADAARYAARAVERVKGGLSRRKVAPVRTNPSRTWMSM
jgi:phage terminase large subunit